MKKPDISKFHFTPSELKIARQLSTGASRKEMSANAGIAVDTLDAHLKNIRRKMHLVSSFRCGIILAQYF